MPAILHITKKHGRLACLNCWCRDQMCERGTLSGCCKNCNELHKTQILEPEPLLNYALRNFMSVLTRPTELCFLTSNFPYKLGLLSVTRGGTQAYFHIEIHLSFASAEGIIWAQLDQFVMSNYITHIHPSGYSSHLVSQAALIRGYLCLIFSENAVIENDYALGNELYARKQHDDNRLSRHLMSLILGRLNGLLWEILGRLRLHWTNFDETNASEISACTAMVYTGLLYVLRGLSSGRLRPLLGGHALASILRQRLASISEEMMLLQIKSCGKPVHWTQHIIGPVDDLQTNVDIQSLTLTLERLYYETPEISVGGDLDLDAGLASPSSSSLRTTSSNTSSFLTTTSQNTPNSDAQTPFYVAVAEPHGPTTSTASQMVLQDSGYHGFDQWNEWPEQSTTWTQY